ncbi:hypothetical protein KCP78_21660 [Salmonella enterica subsp. enterica]|nr:hypothetical protein KCP78_21660 [Salmonella enterica subsp. enterica]
MEKVRSFLRVIDGGTARVAPLKRFDGWHLGLHTGRRICQRDSILTVEVTDGAGNKMTGAAPFRTSSTSRC